MGQAFVMNGRGAHGAVRRAWRRNCAHGAARAAQSDQAAGPGMPP
jgi:hypothetical protein